VVVWGIIAEAAGYQWCWRRESMVLVQGISGDGPWWWCGVSMVVVKYIDCVGAGINDGGARYQ
jgi:hypothetical protein